jgi:sugar diacid utilization regulator
VRERSEIEKSAEEARSRMSVPPRISPDKAIIWIQRLQLEVLLDIRDEVRNRTRDDANQRRETMPAEIPRQFQDNQQAANLWRDLARLYEDNGTELFIRVAESIVSQLKASQPIDSGGGHVIVESRIE